MGSEAPSGATAPQTKRALAALGLGAFVIGTAELVVVGILNLVSASLKVSVSSAGFLVTAYALGIALGAPLVTALTIKVGRRLMLRIALIVFILGNLLAVLAVNFGVLLAARLITGTIHGLFIGVASAVAAALVPAERRGQAVATIFGGIAVSTVVGVPLGTLVGQGLGWRAAFAGIVILGVVALVATLLFVPKVEGSGSGGMAYQGRYAFAPRVLAMLAVGVLVMGGQFTAFTYLTPFTEKVAGVPVGAVTIFLVVFGVFSAIGNFGGGKLADRNASRTLLIGNAVVVLALLLMYLVGTNPVLLAIVLAIWGMAGFGILPALQLRVISLAGPGGDLAATLGASAVNIGIALGSILGGRILAAEGIRDVPLIALIVCAVVLPATWATHWLKAPSDPAPADTESIQDVTAGSPATAA